MRLPAYVVFLEHLTALMHQKNCIENNTLIFNKFVIIINLFIENTLLLLLLIIIILAHTHEHNNWAHLNHDHANTKSLNLKGVLFFDQILITVVHLNDKRTNIVSPSYQHLC